MYLPTLVVFLVLLLTQPFHVVWTFATVNANQLFLQAAQIDGPSSLNGFEVALQSFGGSGQSRRFSTGFEPSAILFTQRINVEACSEMCSRLNCAGFLVYEQQEDVICNGLNAVGNEGGVFTFVTSRSYRKQVACMWRSLAHQW